MKLLLILACLLLAGCAQRKTGSARFSIICLEIEDVDLNQNFMQRPCPPSPTSASQAGRRGWTTPRQETGR